MLDTKRKDSFAVLLVCSMFFFASAPSVTWAKEALTNKVPTRSEARKDDDGGVDMEQVQRFSAALNHVKNFYVEPVGDEKLFENAIRGMLQGLDPHSTYLDEAEFKDLKVSTSGEYGGLGIEITMEDGYVKVVSPIDDTPAAKAGVKAGDLFIKVDDKSIKGMSLREAVEHMRGKVGSPVTITVYRKGAKNNPFQLTLVREKIQIHTVKSKVFDDYYGYVRISHFQSPTANDLRVAVAKLQQQTHNQLRGLVLDLRNNPGGLLDSAIDVSDAFIHNDKQGAEETIVFTKGRISGAAFTAHAKPGDMIQGAPIMVLINEGSASGSEIVAGALQDNQRAVVLGTKSFGKGSVQTILPLDEKRGVKITTARYYTPKGRSIQAKGIEPDIVVEALKISDIDDDTKAAGLATTEASLKGHLNSESSTESVAAKGAEQSEESSEVAKKDYQLFEALNLLKGLHVLQRHPQI